MCTKAFIDVVICFNFVQLFSKMSKTITIFVLLAKKFD